jgi:hypothetical protein
MRKPKKPERTQVFRAQDDIRITAGLDRMNSLEQALGEDAAYILFW